jgi:hypothetical protein
MRRLSHCLQHEGTCPKRAEHRATSSTNARVVTQDSGWIDYRADYNINEYASN